MVVKQRVQVRIVPFGQVESTAVLGDPSSQAASDKAKETVKIVDGTTAESQLVEWAQSFDNDH
jgi:hypothetical protein